MHRSQIPHGFQIFSWRKIRQIAILLLAGCGPAEDLMDIPAIAGASHITSSTAERTYAVTTCTPPEALPVPLQSQCNPSWATTTLRSCGSSMCKDGCAVTSEAMVLEYFGSKQNPADHNACLGSNACLLKWGHSSCLPTGVTYHGTTRDRGRVDCELSEGKPVVAQAHWQWGMHFVVIVGKCRDGSYRINNPYFEDDKTRGAVQCLSETTLILDNWYHLYSGPLPDTSDSDGDGIPPYKDNCPQVANPDQKDSNGDGIGDACSEGPLSDGDGDGVPDGTDNCPLTPNPDQKDSQGIGKGDACSGDPLLQEELSGGCALARGAHGQNTTGGLWLFLVFLLGLLVRLRN